MVKSEREIFCFSFDHFVLNATLAVQRKITLSAGTVKEEHFARRFLPGEIHVVFWNRGYLMRNPECYHTMVSSLFSAITCCGSWTAMAARMKPRKSG